MWVSLICVSQVFSSQLAVAAGYNVEHSLTAHPGGLAALDARGNFVATCGYGMRQGRLAQDTMVKVRPHTLTRYNNVLS